VKGEERLDLDQLVEVSTAGSSRSVKASEKGKVVVEIRARPGAHISDEATVSLEYKPQGVTLDPAASFFEISQEQGTQKVKPGDPARLVASPSDAGSGPLKLKLKGVPLRPEELAGGAAAANAPVLHFPSPRFELPFAAGSVGKASVDADLVFFVCTETGTPVCARAKRSVSVPIEVN
jgi:hypothetical protein